MSIEYKEWIKYSEKDFVAAQFLMTATSPSSRNNLLSLSAKCRENIKSISD